MSRSGKMSTGNNHDCPGITYNLNAFKTKSITFSRKLPNYLHKSTINVTQHRTWSITFCVQLRNHYHSVANIEFSEKWLPSREQGRGESFRKLKGRTQNQRCVPARRVCASRRESRWTSATRPLPLFLRGARRSAVPSLSGCPTPFSGTGPDFPAARCEHGGVQLCEVAMLNRALVARKRDLLMRTLCESMWNCSSFCSVSVLPRGTGRSWAEALWEISYRPLGYPFPSGACLEPTCPQTKLNTQC